jgi:hypothetical protein
MMKSRAMIAAIFTVLTLTACAAKPMDATHAALMQAHMAQSTLEVDCPTGCSIKYRDPRDTLQLPNPVTGAQAVRDIGVALVQQTPILGLTGVSLYGFKMMSDLGAAGFAALNGSGAVTDARVITNTNTDNSVADSRVTTSTDNSVADSRVTTSTDNSIDYSNNAGRIASSDDYTHDPLIVVQPAPVVVTQPAPLVVTQPAPIIVQPE